MPCSGGFSPGAGDPTPTELAAPRVEGADDPARSPRAGCRRPSSHDDEVVDDARGRADAYSHGGPGRRRAEVDLAALAESGTGFRSRVMRSGARLVPRRCRSLGPLRRLTRARTTWLARRSELRNLPTRIFLAPTTRACRHRRASESPCPDFGERASDLSTGVGRVHAWEYGVSSPPAIVDDSSSSARRSDNHARRPERSSRLRRAERKLRWRGSPASR